LIGRFRPSCENTEVVRRTKMWSRKSRRMVLALLPLCMALGLAGCGKFFVPQNSGGGGDNGGGGTSTGNYFYVANETTGSVAGFALGTKGITNTSNSPYVLGVSPSAIAVTPNGKYIYVGTVGAIYGYSVASNGALTLLNGGSAIISSISPSALRVDPSGSWLIAADAYPEAFVFSIDPDSGMLTQQGAQLNLNAGVPIHIVFTPSTGLVYISLAASQSQPKNSGGVQVCTFNQSNGTLSINNQFLLPLSAGNSDYGLAVDPAGKYLFVTETGVNAVRVLSIAASGALTKVSGSPFQTGLGPMAVLVDSTGAYVYVANATDGTVSAFSLAAATGSLTPINGSPFATGTAPSDLAEDTSNTYLGVACKGGNPDFQVFTIGSATGATPGGLTSFAKTTGSNPTGTLAVVAAD
jgi:6-phosphogluconolactonase (cycloisomerase 2 family)